MSRMFAERSRCSLLILILALVGLAAPAAAQPFGAWLNLSGSPTHGYVRVPHAAALNPAGAFTFEAWVSITNGPTGEDCRTIAGKNYLQSWWIGLCRVSGRPTLRSYLKGGRLGQERRRDRARPLDSHRGRLQRHPAPPLHQRRAAEGKDLIQKQSELAAAKQDLSKRLREVMVEGQRLVTVIKGTVEAALRHRLGEARRVRGAAVPRPAP